MATTKKAEPEADIQSLGQVLADIMEQRQQDTLSQLEQHMKDQEARRAKRAKKAPLLKACLDPIVAAEHELKKPVFEFDVSGTYTTKDDDGLGLIQQTFATVVIAQNESDAWAAACDKSGVSVKPIESRTIVKGRRVPVEEWLTQQQRARKVAL